MTSNDNSYFESKEFKNILQQFEKSQTSGNPMFMDSDDFSDIAEYYFNHGDFKNAKKAVHVGLDIFPHSTNLWIIKAKLTALVEKDVTKAYTYLERVEDKSDFEYIYLLGKLKLREEQTEEAEKLFRNHLNDLVEEERENFIFDIASLYAINEQFMKAEDWFELLKSKTDDDCQELKGRILLGLGDYEESERIFQKLIDKNPYSVDYWTDLASLQAINDRFSDAITSCEYAIAINPKNSLAIIIKANSLFNLGNFEEALKYYLAYQQLDPNDVTIDGLIGVSYLQLDQPAKALAHLKRAEQQNQVTPESLAEIYENIALTLSHLGKMDEALSYVDKMQNLECMDMEDIKLTKGHILLENDQVEAAQEIFQEAIRQPDASTYTALKIAVFSYNCGYVQMAYEVLKNLLESVDETWEYGYSYFAVCCKTLNKTDEFIQAVKKACEKNPYEAQKVLQTFFPEGMKPEEYYDFLLQNQ